MKDSRTGPGRHDRRDSQQLKTVERAGLQPEAGIIDIRTHDEQEINEMEEKVFDYGKAEIAMKQIIEHFQTPQFPGAFGEHTETVRELTLQAQKAVADREEPEKILATLEKIKQYAVETGGTLSASVILSFLAMVMPDNKLEV